AAEEAKARGGLEDRGHHDREAGFGDDTAAACRHRKGRRRQCGEGRDRRPVKPIRPMLATLTTEVPTGPSWIFEEKYDGIRALAYRIKKKVRLWSRNELDLTAGFPDVASAVAALPAGDLVLAGELVIFAPA